MATKKNGDSAEPATDPVSEPARMAATTAKHGFDKTVGALKEGMTNAAAGFEKTQAEVKKNMDKVMKTAEEMVSFGQGNVEAVVKSSQIWAAGVQEFGKTFATTAQAQFEQTVSTFKALSKVRSLKEAIDLQSDLARSSFETAFAQTGKFTDASLKLAEQTMAPITARVTLAVEKFGRPV